MNAVNQGNVKRQGSQYYSRTFQATVAGAFVTIDWNNGNVQYVTLPNASTTNLNFINPAPGSRYMLIIKQGGTSASLINWPGVPVMRWMGGGTAPTLSVGAGMIDICGFVYDDVDGLYLSSFQAY